MAGYFSMNVLQFLFFGVIYVTLLVDDSFAISFKIYCSSHRWSNDGKFVARSGNEVLSVYESPVFGLLDKKSIKIPGMKDFTWSPTQNIIAYWVPEDNNAPARVCLMELPSRREIRVKNLFNVHDVRH